MKSERGRGIGTFIILAAVLILGVICVAGQVKFERDKQAAADKKFDQVVELANIEGQALITQAEAIKAQAETNGRAVDQVVNLSNKVVEQSDKAVKDANRNATIAGVAVGLTILVVLVLFIVLGGRPVAA